MVIRPCDCRTPVTIRGLRPKEITAYLVDLSSCILPRGMRIKDIIAHLFDHHVVGKKDWTLETLIAHASLELLSQPQWHDPSDDAAKWQKTREALSLA